MSRRGAGEHRDDKRDQLPRGAQRYEQGLRETRQWRPGTGLDAVGGLARVDRSIAGGGPQR
jgi:hypothetical protein